MVSGVSDKVGYAVSQLHYETDGFHSNNSARKNGVNLFVQGQLSPRASVQLDLRRSDFELGTTFFPFDDLVVSPQTIKEESDVVRLSGHYIVDPTSEWIVSASHDNRDRRAENFPDASVITETQTRTRSLELQRLDRIGPIQLVVGLTNLRERDFFPIEQSDINSRSRTLYAYSQWRVPAQRLSIQGGLPAYEYLDIRNSFFANPIARKRFSPKLGVVWTVRPDTTLRAAAFSAVKRPFIGSQTLEPTQIAGFNQFFTGFDTFYGDPDGTVSKRVGVGVDHRISGDMFAGAELAVRRLDVPSVIAARDFTWKERSAHLYLYDAKAAEPGRKLFPAWAIATSVEYEYEKIRRPQILTGPEGIVDVTTHHLPIGVRLFRGNVALRLTATYVKQSGVFSADVGLDRFPKSDSGWIADMSTEYRLPKRMGTVAVGVRNAFDNSLQLFQVDPLNPSDAVRRFVYAKVRLIF